jgi:type I restriction enzyme S subunit
MNKLSAMQRANAWEQWKVGEITSEVGEYTTLEAGLPLLTSARSGLMYQSEYRGNQATDSKATLFSVVPLNACTYRHMSDDDIFHMNINTLEKGLVSREYPVFSATKENDLNFIVQRLNSSGGFRSFCKEQKKGGTRTRLYYNALCDFTMMVPNLPEQQKISQCLLAFDHLITLHQRKLEHLKVQKAGLLQKMFPKDGSDTPEIRFPGFTDAWEQRALSELASFSKGKGYSKGDLRESGSPIILYGRLYTKYETVISEVDTFVHARDGSVYSKGNEVIVPASGETAEDISRAAVVENAGILLGGDLNVLQPTQFIDPVFLALTISNGEQQKELSKRAQGKSVVHIHNSDLQEVNLAYPRLDEQKRICSLFRDFDHLITLHQRKLEHLKNMKKALLEKMFV